MVAEASPDTVPGVRVVQDFLLEHMGVGGQHLNKIGALLARSLGNEDTAIVCVFNSVCHTQYLNKL